ncbi:hypothetical protein ACLOJK_027168 [Asimina triloba]
MALDLGEWPITDDATAHSSTLARSGMKTLPPFFCQSWVGRQSFGEDGAPNFGAPAYTSGEDDAIILPTTNPPTPNLSEAIQVVHHASDSEPTSDPVMPQAVAADSNEHRQTPSSPSSASLHSLPPIGHPTVDSNEDNPVAVVASKAGIGQSRSSITSTPIYPDVDAPAARHHLRPLPLPVPASDYRRSPTPPINNAFAVDVHCRCPLPSPPSAPLLHCPSIGLDHPIQGGSNVNNVGNDC